MPMGGVMTARPTPARSVGVVTAVPSGRAAPLPPKPSHPRERRGDAVAASWLLLDRHLAERDERPRLAVDVEPADLAGRRPDERIRLDADPHHLVDAQMNGFGWMRIHGVSSATISAMRL